ncbi:MAG TPA: hypothetical protein VFA75_15750 [Nevskia sp.]|nr:hypothetical protein [Nevskia sp.]
MVINYNTGLEWKRVRALAGEAVRGACRMAGGVSQRACERMPENRNVQSPQEHTLLWAAAGDTVGATIGTACRIEATPARQRSVTQLTKRARFCHRPWRLSAIKND